MPPRRASAGPAALAAALVLLLGTACTDDEPEPRVAEPTEPTSTSEPATPEPSEPVVPTYPDAAQSLDKDGAVAFVRHFFAMVNYAQATGDVEPLRALGTSTCSFCLGGVEGIDAIYSAGGRIVGSTYSTEGQFSVRPLRAGQLRLTEVRVKARSAAGRAVDAGDLSERYDPGRGLYRFTLVREKGQWRALSIEVSDV